MTKPLIIDRHLCLGQQEEEKYKDTAIVDYWWGLRELASGFSMHLLDSANMTAVTNDQKKEYAYLQILHYTVYVKLAGASYQLDKIKNIINSTSSATQFQMFEVKECFDALHSSLYQSLCALCNQVFTLINSSSTIKKGLNPSKVIAWLDKQKERQLSNLLMSCNKCLDIRHHITHYGYIPTFQENNRFYIQEGSHQGDIMSTFDLILYKAQGGKLIEIIEVSESKIKLLCDIINKVYEHVYTKDVFEGYLCRRCLKLKNTNKPYWERSNDIVSADLETGFASGTGNASST